MGIVVEGFGSVAAHLTDAAITPGAPSGVAAGDTLLAFCCQAESIDTVTMSSEWTKLKQINTGGNYAGLHLWKLQYSAGTPNYTMTGTSGRRKRGVIMRVSGTFSTSEDLDGEIGTHGLYAYGSTKPGIATVDTAFSLSRRPIHNSTPNCLMVIFTGSHSNGSFNATFPGGWTEQLESDSASGAGIAIGTKIQTAAGADADAPVVTIAGAYDGNVGSIIIALTPADEDPATPIVSFGATASGGAGVTTVTPGLPPRIVSGDLLLCIVNVIGGTVSMNSSDWTSALSASQAQVFWHRYAGADPDRTVTRGGTIHGTEAIIFAFRDIAGVNPIHAADGGGKGTTAPFTVDNLVTTIETFNIAFACKGAKQSYLYDAASPPSAPVFEYRYDSSSSLSINVWAVAQNTPGDTYERRFSYPNDSTSTGHIALGPLGPFSLTASKNYAFWGVAAVDSTGGSNAGSFGD